MNLNSCCEWRKNFFVTTIPESNVNNGGCDETPGDVMIHVVPEGSKSRWSHIEDLVSLFCY